VVAPLFLPRENWSFDSGKNNGVVPRTLCATPPKSCFGAAKLRINLAYPMWDFIRENVVFVSALAFVLSVLSFVYTYFRDRAQTKRWEALNLARVVVRNLRLACWKTVTRSEFDRIQWGYSDILGISSVDESGNMDIDHIGLPIQVVFLTHAGKPITGTNATSVAELTSILQKNGIDPSTVEFHKLLRIVFQLVNSGGTTAKNIVLEVFSSDAEVNGKTPQRSEIGFFEPDEQTWSMTNLRFLLEEDLPDQFHLTIHYSYADIRDKRHDHTFHYVLDKSVGTFRRTHVAGDG